MTALSNFSFPLLLALGLALPPGLAFPLKNEALPAMKPTVKPVSSPLLHSGAKHAVSRPGEIDEYFQLYGSDPGKRELLLEKLNLLKEKFPNNPYVFSALSLAARPKPLLLALEPAKLALRAGAGLRREERSILTSNLAALCQANGEKERAYKLYEAAIALDGANWRARLGLAQVAAVDGSDGRVIALKEMQLVQELRDADYERLLTLGQTYFVLEMYSQAKAVLLEALKLAQAKGAGNAGFKGAGNAAENLAAIKMCLLKSCVEEKKGLKNGLKNDAKAPSGILTEVEFESESGNVPGLKALVADSLGAAFIDPETAIYLARTPLTGEQMDLLWSKVRERFIGDGKFYYEFARLMESAGRPRFDLAQASYLEAVRWSAGGLDYLSLAANLARQGKAEELRKLFKETTFAHKDKYRNVFEKVGRLYEEKGENFQNVSLYKGVLKNLKCGCRMFVIEYGLETNKGILLARLEDKKEPPVVVIFNNELIPPAQLAVVLQGVTKEQEKFEAISVEPLNGLVELVGRMQKLEDLRKRKSFNMWSFVPPPLKLL